MAHYDYELSGGAYGGAPSNDDELHQLKVKVDFPRLVATQLHREGRSLRGPCPLHGGENPTRFSVYQRANGEWGWRCFGGCGIGSPIDYLIAYESLTIGQAIQRLREVVAGQGNYVAPPPSPPRRNRAPMRVSEAYKAHARLYDDTSLTEDVVDEATGLVTPRPVKAWDVWLRRAITPPVIERFVLGYDPHCPTARDKHRPGATFDSLTIPIFKPGGTEMVTMRHRVLQPTGSCGKYLPHRAGDGIHLFHADALGTGEKAVGILEGEIKVLFWYARELGDLLPVISAIGGINAWDAPESEDWIRRLLPFDTVYVLFDPEPEARMRATKLARRLGRRGKVVHLPSKVDDLVIRGGDDALGYLIRAFGAAR